MKVVVSLIALRSSEFVAYYCCCWRVDVEEWPWFRLWVEPYIYSFVHTHPIYVKSTLLSMFTSPLSLRSFFFLYPRSSFARKCKFSHQIFPKPFYKDYKVILNPKLLGYPHRSCAEKFVFSLFLCSYCVKMWVLLLSATLP